MIEPGIAVEDPGRSSNLISNLPAEIAINTAKVDYVKPIRNGRLEAGAKASFINTDNVASFFDENNGQLAINDDFTNSFAYEENIQAAYMNVNQDWKKFSVQAGLRYERTGITGKQYGSRTSPDSTFLREFNNLFPTIYLQYKPDSAGSHQVSFSYGRRIDRPDYQSMNPFTYPLDRFTIYSGNPFLQPTFSNNFELAYNYKNVLNTALVFGYVRDVISETISQGANTFYSKPGNIGRQLNYGVTADFGKPLAKWWTLQLHTEVMHNINQATLYGQELDNRRTYWYIGPVNQLTFTKGWNAELSGSYISRVASGQFVVIAVGSVNLAVSKKLLSDRLVVKLAVNDVFYSNRPGGEILGLENSTASWRSRLDTRVATLSLSYRISRGKNVGPRSTGAADSEKSRVR